MVNKFRAAILESSCSNLIVDTIEIKDPLKAGQVLVRILFSGICGAQINEIDAVKGPDKFLPHLLGHEGLGEVVEVGPLVTTVSKGDRVVLHWMNGEGLESEPASYSWNGKHLNAGWVTTLSEYSIVSENRITKLDVDLDPRYAPLLGCAATTAWGSLVNDANFRMGENVVVIGVGGVGLLVVEAARAAGANVIVAIDMFEEKLEFAEKFGSTYGYLSNEQDLISKINNDTGELSAEVVIETTGSKSMIELAYKLASHGGRAVLVGVPRRAEPATIDTLDSHFGMKFMGSKGGGINPTIDIPRLARMAKSKKYNFTNLPIEVLKLDDINLGIDSIRNGKPGRIVIDMTS